MPYLVQTQTSAVDPGVTILTITHEDGPVFDIQILPATQSLILSSRLGQLDAVNMGEGVWHLMIDNTGA